MKGNFLRNTFLTMALAGMALAGNTLQADSTPAKKTSFEAVTSQLDPGGAVYGYISTEEWMRGLSTNVSSFRELMIGVKEVSESERVNINHGFDLLSEAIEKSGVEDIDGAGISGVKITPELYRTKFILHHPDGQGQGLFWNALGQKPHPLAGLDLLPKNTALAVFGDVDVAGIWQALANGLGRSEIPELSQGISRWPQTFEKMTKLSWNKLLMSYGGEVGVVLTLDPAREIEVPTGASPLQIGAPGLLLAVKMKDDLLYDRLRTELKKSPGTVETEEKGLKMCALSVPVPLNMPVEITVARSGGYLFLASSTNLVLEALAVQAGTQPGLRQTEGFKTLAKYLPAEGNQFTYIDRRFSQAMIEVQLAMSRGNPMSGVLRKIMTGEAPNYGLAISAHTGNGWQSVSAGNQNSANTLVAAPLVGGSAVMAGMLLPALARAKERAQTIACVNNLKQVGIGFRLWATDHDGKYPFQVSTNQGGSMELCQRNAYDGYDENTAAHFQALLEEIGSPKVLVCPADSKHKIAAQGAELRAENVSYEIRTAPEVSEENPGEILLYCPIHRNAAFADGSVQMKVSKK